MAEMPFGSFAPSTEQPAQSPLSSADLYAHIRRDPRLRDAFLSSILGAPPNSPQQPGAIPRDNARLQDSAENAFSLQTLAPIDIRRMFGGELTPHQRILDTFLTARGATPLTMGRGNRFTPMGGLLPR